MTQKRKNTASPQPMLEARRNPVFVLQVVKGLKSFFFFFFVGFWSVQVFGRVFIVCCVCFFICFLCVCLVVFKQLSCKSIEHLINLCLIVVYSSFLAYFNRFVLFLRSFGRFVIGFCQVFSGFLVVVFCRCLRVCNCSLYV